MRWTKSIILLLLSFCFCFGLYPLKQAKAAVTNNNIIIVRDTNNNKYIIVASYNSDGAIRLRDDNGLIKSYDYLRAIANRYNYVTLNFDTVNDAIAFINGNEDYITNSYYVSTDLVIKYRGEVIFNGSNDGYFDSVADYEESIAPTWYENAWDTFVDYFTNPVPFQWFKNLINRVFDDDVQTNISDGVNLTNPTLTPPPTPIPYSTVVIPKTDVNTGDTYYETNYIYANPSGTPIIQPYPPTSQPSGNSGGSDDNYYPVDGEPLKLPKLKWLSPVTIGDTNYDGIDSIYDGLSSVDDIGSEYTDGISAVSDATSVLPTNWLMLIGIAAAIPLLAGIISRFLS